MFNPLKKHPEYMDKAKNTLYANLRDNTLFWDPTGSSPFVSHIKEANLENYGKYLFLKDNPRYVNNMFFKIVFSILGIIIFFGAIHIFLFKLSFIFYVFGLLLFIIPLVFRFQVSRIIKDVVKLDVALENNYLYWPHPNANLWNKYAKKYPDLFMKGTKRQNFDDIFWGETIFEGKKSNFVSGVFNYIVETGSGKDRKEYKYTDHFFCIKSPKILKSEFFLYPEGFASKIINFFNKKKIHTESIKFNEVFAFSYTGNKSEKQMDITKILTPRIQEELLNIHLHFKNKKSFFNRNSCNGLRVLFSDKEIFFYGPGPLIKKLKTNFFKDGTVHDEDKAFLKKELDTMISISNNIIKYLD